jgi:POT family proton-dependent oligopeptide transporter
VVIIVLCLASAMFWAGFEQAGSSFNLFAERYTDRTVLGLDFPTGWFQSLNPVFIIIFAPLFAWMWIELAKRNLNPRSPTKFAFGLILLAAGFAVMIGAAKLVSGGSSVAAYWLISTYLLHTLGELCLSPVGLSAISKLAPQRFVGQMMGLWFLAFSLGNILAGLLAGRFNADAVADMPGLYLQIVLTSAGSGLLLLAASRPLARWMGKVH